MTRDEFELVADRVVDALFVNGFGERAERLELRSAGERNLGGWGRIAVRRIVLAALSTEPTR